MFNTKEGAPLQSTRTCIFSQKVRDLIIQLVSVLPKFTEGPPKEVMVLPGLQGETEGYKKTGLARRGEYQALAPLPFWL